MLLLDTTACILFLRLKLVTKAVGFQIDDVQKTGFEADQLRRIHLAFEHGILNALTEIEAGFRRAAEAGFAGWSAGGNIVGDENIHTFEI